MPFSSRTDDSLLPYLVSRDSIPFNLDIISFLWFLFYNSSELLAPSNNLYYLIRRTIKRERLQCSSNDPSLIGLLPGIRSNLRLTTQVDHLPLANAIHQHDALVSATQTRELQTAVRKTS